MKIDMFAHITTDKYQKALSKYSSPEAMTSKIVKGQPTLWNLEEKVSYYGPL